MRRHIPSVALLTGLFLFTPPAIADVAEVVNDVVQPAYAQLAAGAAKLAEAAAHDCAPQALRAPYHAVWDDWARIDFMQIGPIQTNGRALAMYFWPDAKGSGPRAQQALVSADSDMLDDPNDFASLSVAVRGLAGLERLIYPSRITGPEEVLCQMRRATTQDLAQMTQQLHEEWDAYAPQLLAPGEGDHTTYLTEAEARQAVFTQILTGLKHNAETRLGRPLGSFDAPRPLRAEATASGRSLRNVEMSLRGLRDAALAFSPSSPLTKATFDHAVRLASELDDPTFSGVTETQGRLKVEILQKAVIDAFTAVEEEIGGKFDLTAGFNAKDGD